MGYRSAPSRQAVLQGAAAPAGTSLSCPLQLAGPGLPFLALELVAMLVVEDPHSFSLLLQRLPLLSVSPCCMGARRCWGPPHSRFPSAGGL